MVLLNIVLNITAKKIKPIKVLVDNDSNAYQINVICMKDDVNRIKESIYEQVIKDNNIVNAIAVNSITPDKYRICVKIGTAHNDEYFVKLTNHVFDMNVLSVSYEKLDQ